MANPVRLWYVERDASQVCMQPPENLSYSVAAGHVLNRLLMFSQYLLAIPGESPRLLFVFMPKERKHAGRRRRRAFRIADGIGVSYLEMQLARYDQHQSAIDMTSGNAFLKA